MSPDPARTPYRYDMEQPGVAPLVVVSQDQLAAMREVATPKERATLILMVASGRILVRDPVPPSVLLGPFV
jgi:hypothetical protein